MAKRGKYQAAKAKTKTKKRAGALVPGIVLLVLIAAAAGIFVWGGLLKNGSSIYPNVRLAGVEVGGMNRIAAREAVEAAVEGQYAARPLEVVLPDRTIVLDPEQTNVALDAESAVNEAMAYGREGNPFEAVISYFRCRGEMHDIPLETALELDTEYIRQMLEQTAAQADEAPVQAKMDYDQSTGRLTVTTGKPGRKLDTEALYDRVYEAFQNRDLEPIQWPYSELPCELTDLTEYHESLSRKVEDAYYDAENHQIVAEVPGFGFDLTAANQKLAMAGPGEQVTIQLEEIPAAVTAEQLTSEMFGTKLESRSSKYVSNANRTENLRLACEAINGTILNPGEVFSFNNIVGERTKERGYKPATIYTDGGASEESEGGGVCQVASTIYYATLYLDLEQVERVPHMYVVTYVPMGMDATVFWDSKLDYRFRNSLSNPIKIQANIDGGSVNITFWGVKENDNTVKMEYAVLETYDWEEVEEVDEEKEPGYREQVATPYTGYKVEAYKTVYDKDGNVIKRETIHSLYNKRDKKFIVGPSEEEPPVDGEYPDGEWPDGTYPDGTYPDGEYPDGWYPDSVYPDNEYPDNEYPDGENPFDTPDSDNPESVWP